MSSDAPVLVHRMHQSFHRNGEDDIRRRTAVEPPSLYKSKHLEFPKTSNGVNDGPPSNPGPSSDVIDGCLGSPVRFRVTVEHKPDDGFVRSQLAHSLVNEGIQNLEAKPRLTLRGLPPGGPPPV